MTLLAWRNLANRSSRKSVFDFRASLLLICGGRLASSGCQDGRPKRGTERLSIRAGHGSHWQCG